MLELTINGKNVSAPDGSTILQCAKLAGIKIPTLCNLPGIHTNGSCRICVVEVEGQKNLMASCIVKAQNNMVVKTNTEKVQNARKILYDLLISNHPTDCMSCERNQSCELQEMGYTLGVTKAKIPNKTKRVAIDVSPAITRDQSKCILCRRCVTACNDVQGVGAISSQNRGFDTTISPSMDLMLEDVNCAMCGQCSVVCPTGAIIETDAIDAVWAALADPKKRVSVQVAPAVRAALGEEFGLEVGTRVTGRMATALHDLGFDDVFDTNFAADLTIMEEGTELLHRLKDALTGGSAVLPMITSCSPGWIKHIEHAYPEELGHLSSCKSPHMMLGALIKSFYAEKINVPPEDFYVVSVMPCTAKKYEIQRPEMQDNGNFDVDAVITTREFARMIKTAGIDFVNLPAGKFDDPLGFSTGAADIFGVTGGVMEAALRTVYELTTGRELPFEGLHITPIVGLENIKDASVTFENVKPEFSFLEGVTARVAVASGLKNADVLLQQIADGTSPYHFIEVMGCPSGCINGGGQPRMAGKPEDYRLRRMKAIYAEDESKALRKSHENPSIQSLYANYLQEPCGHISHHLLHTTYTKRGNFNECIAK